MDEDPEGYAITTSHLPDSTVADCPRCSSPWLWIILFVLFLLLSIGFLIWALWLLRREKNCSGCTGPGVPIAFSSARVNVDSDTQISGTWVTTDPDEVVTLFATLHPPIFSGDGSLTNPQAATLFKQAGAAAIGPTGITGPTGTTGTTGTVNSVSLSGLTPGLKYYATLIARNPRTHNYKSYTQIVYMESGNITTFTNGATGSILNTFEIQDILQVGAIQLSSDVADANGIYTVQFNQRPRQARDLFYFNPQSQLQLSPANATGLEGLCLFNNGGNLVAASCTNGITGATAGSIPNTSYFVYNPQNNANKLCLKNTVDTGTPTCLKMTGISNGIGTVSFSNATLQGDAWALAFENGQ